MQPSSSSSGGGKRAPTAAAAAAPKTKITKHSYSHTVERLFHFFFPFYILFCLNLCVLGIANGRGTVNNINSHNHCYCLDSTNGICLVYINLNVCCFITTKATTTTNSIQKKQVQKYKTNSDSREEFRMQCLFCMMLGLL